ncbi:MAG: T9SS type A sorting domain-containing protein [Candidatus Aegiribacteria sp.]|nr:T9SS type A sorting domain-containing protein [Candidatus Aegiribacteria sp.]
MLDVLLISAALASGFTGYSEITDTNADGYTVTKTIMMIDGEIVENTEQLTAEETSWTLNRDIRGEVLWVDRIHNNAIANETVISSDGEGIFASWYLSNDRVSRYGTHGTEIPIWSYSMSINDGKMDVAAGQDTLVFSAGSYDEGVFAWLTSSSVPSVTLDPGIKQDITLDGQYLVYINASGDSLICENTSTKDQVWKIELYVPGTETCGVEITGNGSRVLVSVRDNNSGCQVYEMADGSLVGTPVGNYSQSPARISDDGTRLVNCEFNGRVKLYEFNGTAWDQVGNFYTGHTWATAAGISGDGETAAGGTMGTSPLKGKVIAFDWPAGGSPSQMWEYTDYGDFVTSIDISEDGSVIVAGSWGMYNGTLGDVFTAFDRSGNVIFNLLDDIDEPGSIFSVSVSSDGCYATASGKAVHARMMGNGGEVYSIDLTSTGIGENPSVPLTCWMGEPYPNPTTSQISVEFLIPPTVGIVDLAVYDINGRRMATLNSETTPGVHVSVWNLGTDTGESLSSGLYFIRLTTPGTIITRKVLILD